MAGEWLLDKLNSRGGSDSDYADVMFGQVVSEKPLKIQLSNQITLTDNFLVLDKRLGKYDLDAKIDGKKVTIEIDDSLKKGDGVTLFRFDGGQQFYVLDKTEVGASDE
ncbi:DUF2577 domain-containing protein [Lentilactobacillus sp. Marseille-Q4993]|uniref:DUF2577 domain-containing protein n=1 Tax=Lentilactobacillus sp. Marseille-Q4993 TaxID=3039492 RepID=UPI0024BCA9F5|nr:DUF2577 domain-containing protein [Lentilactobacillus sp. Marseille-Q4993]